MHDDDLLPASPVPGLIPTLNKTGWMTEALDPYSLNFAAYAGTIGAKEVESLDIGCAYGIATLAALEAGALMCASDMEPRHLDILLQRVPEPLRDRCRCVSGTLPDIDFPDEQFGAILASRVLHFLSGADIETAVGRMHRWVRPGGRVFLIADTPYTGPWYVQAERYEARKAAGDPWPGFVDDYAALLPAGTDAAGHPAFINPLDPDILTRVCTAAGFDIISAEFLQASTPRAKGREHAGIIAQKP